MTSWQKLVESTLGQRTNKVAEIDIERGTVRYTKKIKHHRTLESLTGDEEVVRAFLLDRLVNGLDYRPDDIETEKEYTIRGGHAKITPRIDVIVRGKDNSPHYFIEVKSPQKFEQDKDQIEGQLFALAQAEEQGSKTKVAYLVYYTAELVGDELVDRALIIDYNKFPTYEDWEAAGFVSLGTELVAGYGEPQKKKYQKGHEKYDLRVRIDREELRGLGRNLHNVLWGGGGTNDSEIFYSLVNIILAKIQDESETEDGQDYGFQVLQYGAETENPHKVFERINTLYRRALRQQLNMTDDSEVETDSVINQSKFPLNKLVYTVQSLESLSFLEGRASLDGRDILGDFFESITRDGFKQHKGQFFTPANIVNFILYGLQLDVLAVDRLNNDRELPLVIDPSAGSATFLVEAMKLITRETKYRQRSKVRSSKQIQRRFQELFTPDDNENKWAREYLYGAEINFDLGTASKVNMILHGDGSANMFIKSGLLPFRMYTKATAPNYLETTSTDPSDYPKEINGKFDVVVSNPPFSVDLDRETQREVRRTFVFGDKRNSENLFIERYYQLLKEKGRLGVVLPESVFDTTENKYIRLFIFKYFNVKAIVSLPELTFEPFTSTKTTVLLAQKKTAEEVEVWNSLWNKYSKEWGTLKRRITAYVQYYVENMPLNRRWAGDVVHDIQAGEDNRIRQNIFRYLKDHVTAADESLTIQELLTRYLGEIDSVSKPDRERSAFGVCNTWWVFGEIAKHLDYQIVMAEAANVGYKRTRRADRIMPNDLFDLEFVPEFLDCEQVIRDLEDRMQVKEPVAVYRAEKLPHIESRDIDKAAELRAAYNSDSAKMGETETLRELKTGLEHVRTAISEFYEDNELKPQYKSRDNPELIRHFSDGGLLHNYKSENILLRKKSAVKILDAIRQEVHWA